MGATGSSNPCGITTESPKSKRAQQTELDFNPVVGVGLNSLKKSSRESSATSTALPSLSRTDTPISASSGSGRPSPSSASDDPLRLRPSGRESISPVAGASCTSGTESLAARRKFIHAGKDKLQVLTKTEGSETRGRRRIRQTEGFAQEYRVGEEVMPSCHKGMQVLKGTQVETGVEVVVKIRFKKESFRNKEEESEWRSASEFMLNLPDCSNIAQVMDVMEDSMAYYVIMEKVGGQDLFESVSGQQELLPVEEVKDILCQILQALADLHLGGRIHKDLKLENVMLDRTPKSSRVCKARTSSSVCASLSTASVSSSVAVKLIDFDTVEEYVPETPKPTKDVLGTDQYIAQEAYDGNYSPASDIFAVGVIAYRLLTGRFPFKADLFDDKPGENWVGSPKMKEIRTKLQRFKIKWTYRAFEAEPRACDLLRSMLAISERDRPTAAEALSHPWLSRRQLLNDSPKKTVSEGHILGQRRSHRPLLLPNCVFDT